MNEFGLTIEKLSLSQGDFSLEIPRLVVPEGKMNLLVGPNGAGKTSLMETILGIRQKQEGSIVFETDGRRFDNLKAVTGFVPTDLTFFPSAFGIDLVRFVGSLYPNFNREEFLELADCWQVPVARKLKTFSMGERRRLFLALALCRDIRLLILDEPLSSLDPDSSYKLIDLLMAQIAERNITIWVSTHILDPFWDVVHNMAFLQGGRLKTIKNQAELKGERPRALWEKVFC